MRPEHRAGCPQTIAHWRWRVALVIACRRRLSWSALLRRVGERRLRDAWVADGVHRAQGGAGCDALPPFAFDGEHHGAAAHHAG